MISRLLNFPTNIGPNALKVCNFVWFQSIWWLLILFQSQAVIGVLVLMTLWLWLTPKVKSDAVLILTIMLVGMLIDSMLMTFGVFIFESYSNQFVIPFWLVLLWGAYAGTLQHSMSMFEGRPMLCVIAGAVAAPLSYLGGARLGAVELGYTATTTFVVLALVWAIVFPLSFVIAQKIQHFQRYNAA